MSVMTAKEVFDKHTHFTVDNKFVTQALQFVQGFINRNDQHTEFFGGPLWGVHKVTFGDMRDGDRWLEEVLGVDDVKDLIKEFHNCEGINKNFHVSSNIYTNSFIYACHRALQSNLKNETKELLAKHMIFIMHARWLTGMLFKRFPNPGDPSIAMALYEQLDNRTDLKMTGSWYNLFMFRADTILDDRKGIHKKVFTDYQTEADIVIAINDLENRLVKMINELTRKFYKIRDSQSRIINQSSITEIDGEQSLRDFGSSILTLKREMQSICDDPRSLIKGELIDLTKAVIDTVDTNSLREVLDHFADNYRAVSLYRDIAEDITVYIYDLARSNKIDMADSVAIVDKVKGLYRSSQTRKEEIVRIKANIKTLIEDSLPRARDTIKVSSNIGFFIYMVLRILSISRYKV